VLAGVVLAEEKIVACREHGPYPGRGAATVAAVVLGENGRCVGGEHGGRPR
jgi:hypothetical protein